MDAPIKYLVFTAILLILVSFVAPSAMGLSVESTDEDLHKDPSVRFLNLELEILTDEDERRVSEPIEFKVSTRDGPIGGAVLSYADGESTTDANGTATLKFDEASTFEVEVDKDYDIIGGRRDLIIYYYSDGVEISIQEDIEQIRRELDVEVLSDEGERIEGEEIELRVTSDGDPVEGTTLIYKDREVGTDEEGIAAITFDRAGTFEVTAEKESEMVENTKIVYDECTINITVIEKVDRDLEKVDRELDVEVLSDEGERIEGEEIELRVTSDGNPVEGATIKYDDKMVDTNEEGIATITFDETGTFDLEVEKDSEKLDDKHINYISDDKSLEIDEEALEETPGLSAFYALISLIAAVFLIRSIVKD